MGTPGYMAPEQASGDAKRVGPAADVYGLGAILYECLTGRPPFEGPALEVLFQVIEDAPVPPSRLRPAVPRDLETVCLKCLEKEPARRYATAADLADDLRRFLDDQPILARPPSVAYRLAKFARRNKVLVAGVAAVFLALVAGLIGTGVGLARANAERERAEPAERDVRRALTESYAQAADLALQRGAWRAALENLDKALAAGHPDQARLRLEKVRALAAVHELPAAEAELRELRRRDDLGDLEGRVLLWQADLALARMRKTTRGCDWPAKPWPDRFPRPTGSTPSGLLAATVPEAAGHFRKALALDRFHHRSLGMLGLLLVVQGETGEARELVGPGPADLPRGPDLRRAASPAARAGRERGGGPGRGRPGARATRRAAVRGGPARSSGWSRRPPSWSGWWAWVRRCRTGARPGEARHRGRPALGGGGRPERGTGRGRGRPHAPGAPGPDPQLAAGRRGAHGGRGCPP